MTNAIIEARFCWDAKLVRPVTTISCGGEWIMETKTVPERGSSRRSMLSLGRNPDDVIPNKAEHEKPRRFSRPEPRNLQGAQRTVLSGLTFGMVIGTTLVSPPKYVTGEDEKAIKSLKAFFLRPLGCPQTRREGWFP